MNDQEIGQSERCPEPHGTLGMTGDLSRLSVQQIQTFCVVYETGGYVGAEQMLGLSGPTMWEQIKVLERVYSAQLFQRVGRNIQPTTAGETLYRILSPLRAGLESTLELMAEDSQDLPKSVNLVTGVRMLLEELGEPLVRFHHQYPTVDLKLTTADNRTARQWVQDSKADLALLIEPPREIIGDQLHCQRLYPIEYLAALPPKHRLIRKPDVTLVDLLAEPLIVGNPNTVGRQLLDQACFRLGIAAPLRIVAETDNSASTVACVRAGLGVGIIAGCRDGNLTRHVATRSLAADLGQVHVVAVYRSGRQLTTMLRSLLDTIQEVQPGHRTP